MEKSPTPGSNRPGTVTTDDLLSGAAPSLTLEPRPAGAPAPLSAETVRDLVSAAPLPPPRRRLLEGLALLWHDHWDLAHGVAQSHEGQADYDLLHAMGHRREGDYPNAEYWFRSAGKHPSFLLLDRAADSALPAGDPFRKSLLPGGNWSPRAFVADVRKHAAGQAETTEILIRLQALEFRAFADWLLSA